MPTPAPGNMAPVVCGATVEAVANAQLDAYRGPDRRWRNVWVTRDGPFAYVGWGVGETGGQSVYRQSGNQWCRIANGGGAMDERELIEYMGPVHGKRIWDKANHKQ